MDEAECARLRVDVDDVGRGTREILGDKLGELGIKFKLVGVEGLDGCFIALRNGYLVGLVMIARDRGRSLKSTLPTRKVEVVIFTMSTDGEKENRQQSESTEQSGSSSSSSPEPGTGDGEAQDPPSTASSDTVANATDSPQWQAIWSPQYNAYYFYNPVTQETTWTNPLHPEESSVSTVSADRTPPADAGSSNENADVGSSTGLTHSASSHYAALQAAAVAQGIDPALAHLDPSLGAPLQGTSNLPGGTH